MTEQRPDDTVSYYSPPPEPRPTWSQEAWNTAATPSQWIEPYPAPGQAPTAPTRSAGLAFVVIAALVAATLASAGTYAALDMSGNLNRPAPIAAVGASPASSSASTEQVVTVNEQSAIVQAAQTVSPAVVTITTQETSSLDPFSLPTTGVGSGIIYNSNGWIVTNHHVVAGASGPVQVQLKDGQEYSGTVYGTDTLTDLAIVKINATGLPAAQIGDSSTLEPGQLAIAIGSPLGTFTDSVTSGIISALGRQIQVTDDETGQPVTLNNLIQTDAAINPGNSGGALLNASGQVIGINTATASTAQGIGFAIPINIARPIMTQAVDGQKLSRPWIGIRFTSLDLQDAAAAQDADRLRRAHRAPGCDLWVSHSSSRAAPVKRRDSRPATSSPTSTASASTRRTRSTCCSSRTCRAKRSSCGCCVTVSSSRSRCPLGHGPRAQRNSRRTESRITARRGHGLHRRWGVPSLPPPHTRHRAPPREARCKSGPGARQRRAPSDRVRQISTSAWSMRPLTGTRSLRTRTPTSFTGSRRSSSCAIPSAIASTSLKLVDSTSSRAISNARP